MYVLKDNLVEKVRNLSHKIKLIIVEDWWSSRKEWLKITIFAIHLYSFSSSLFFRWEEKIEKNNRDFRSCSIREVIEFKMSIFKFKSKWIKVELGRLFNYLNISDNIFSRLLQPKHFNVNKNIFLNPFSLFDLFY